MRETVVFGNRRGWIAHVVQNPYILPKLEMLLMTVVYEDRLLRELLRGLYRALRSMRGQILVFRPGKLLSFADYYAYHIGRGPVKYLMALRGAGLIINDLGIRYEID